MPVGAIEPQLAQRSEARARMRRRALFGLRVVVPVAAMAYLLRIVPLTGVVASMSRAKPLALVEVSAVVCAAMAIATIRWRMLARACGIDLQLGFWELYRCYWIGAFYNSYVPGGLGGDVVRGIATRQAVGPGGLPTALAIVLLERVLGLAGLLILVTAAFLIVPLRVIPHVMAWSALGMCGVLAAIVAVVSAPRLAPHLPARLARIALSLPAIESLPRFGLSLGLSVLTQLSGVVCGHLIVSSLSSHVTWGQSLVVLPLINAAQYFPLSIGGAGIREAGFVLLYGLCGVAKSDALAASLLLAATFYALNLSGGVMHALRRLPVEPANTPSA